MMPYKLFIDDERYPIRPDCMIARTSFDAIYFVQNYGLPIEMMLDHDLGGQDTAMVFLKWFEKFLDETDQTLLKGFTYSIHSQNPIGANAMKLFMEDLILQYGE